MFGNSAETDSTYDQVSICAFLIWKGQVQQEQLVGTRGGRQFGVRCSGWGVDGDPSLYKTFLAVRGTAWGEKNFTAL
jgi:hypothetical protein